MTILQVKSIMPLLLILVFIATIELLSMVRTRYRAGMPVAAVRAVFCNFVVWLLYAGLVLLVNQR
jgi:hypothetical protein